MGNLLFEEETFAIRGAVFEVYRKMGCGFLKTVYQECLEKKLKTKGFHSYLRRTYRQSGRRRDCPRRPPTPPGIRFRTTAVHIVP